MMTFLKYYFIIKTAKLGGIMKKTSISILIIIISLFLLTACQKDYQETTENWSFNIIKISNDGVFDENEDILTFEMIIKNELETNRDLYSSSFKLIYEDTEDNNNKKEINTFLINEEESKSFTGKDSQYLTISIIYPNNATNKEIEFYGNDIIGGESAYIRLPLWWEIND